MLLTGFKKLILSIPKFYKVKKPNFEHLDYTLLIIKNQPYLILSWKANNNSYLSIPAIDFISFKKAGSAYIKLKEDYNNLTIQLGNLWRRTSLEMHFQKIIIDTRINYENVLIEEEKIHFKTKLKRQKIVQTSPVFDFTTIKTKLPDMIILNKIPVLNTHKLLFNQNTQGK